MMKFIIVGLILVSTYGCASRSISDTGYSQSERRGYYKSEVESKELEELVVLGIDKKQAINQGAIEKALTNFKKINIPKDSSILLVQSGSEFPDSVMIESLSDYWNVNQVSGDSRKYKESNLNNVLRYTAATGGNGSIFVYWGIVETSEKNLGTKNVSWVPIVGWSLPDEVTNMRIRLKFAVIDVKTGNWQLFQPKPVEEEFFSSIMNREDKDQEKVIELKKLVYKKAAEELHKKFGI